MKFFGKGLGSCGFTKVIAVYYIFFTAYVCSTAGASVTVSDYTQLKTEVEGEEGASNIAVVEDTIEFDQEIRVNHNGVAIAGSEEDRGEFNGKNASRFFVLKEGSKGISFKNLEFNGGKFGGDGTEVIDGNEGEGEGLDGESEKKEKSGGSEKEVKIETIKTSSDDSDSSNGINGETIGEISGKSGGGALLLEAGTVVSFENSSFSDSVALNSSGGAILSLGDIQNRNSLSFGNSTFSGNKSTDGFGGAIYVNHSDLNLGGKTIFKGNNSSISAKNDNSASFAGSGGAIAVASSSNLIFGGKTTFRNNSSTGPGGAVFLYGNVDGRNFLIFRETALFASNRTLESEGGAISFFNSELTFEKKVNFKGNESNGEGGAISSSGSIDPEEDILRRYMYASRYDRSCSSVCRSVLNFRSEAVFENNRAIKSHVEPEEKEGEGEGEGFAVHYVRNHAKGGAIYAEHSDLNFEKKVIFKKNDIFVSIDSS
jgi:predicted outer membrane repeat protein